ncbi:hypothetical protein FHL15_011048 [Xylaria flabelliformis]|uniref:Uncharacterized protein n=1 Tax=Xylaria flabelliformis TaxID=2512241 RepID=A0A553HJB6_9PEZI|nr:hypothetical protein FHL15_011048 [Xylaria flabelliformis]
MKLSQVLLGMTALMSTGIGATPLRPEALARSSSALDGDVLYDKPVAEKREPALDGDVLYDKPVAERRSSTLDGDVLYDKPVAE